MIERSQAGRLRISAAFAFVAAMLACAPASAGLRIGGTGSAIPSLSALSEAYAAVAHQERPRVLGNLGTAGALKALDAGALDIAVASRPLGPAESVRFHAVPLSRTALVFAAHRSLGMKAVSLRQAMRLYGGEQPLWPDGQRVRPILRPMTDSDTTALRAISADFSVAVLRAHAIKGLQTAVTDEESIAAIASTPGAFGTTTLAMLASDNGSVTALALDGVAPTTRALEDGAYPLDKTFYVVFRTPASAAVRGFVDFVFSERGRSILRRYGQVPVSR